MSGGSKSSSSSSSTTNNLNIDKRIAAEAPVVSADNSIVNQAITGPTKLGKVRIGVARLTSVRRSTMEKPPVLVMKTGVDQVAAGGDSHGWVSGDPANLPAATLRDCIFDLGPDWDQYGQVGFVVVSAGPATGYQSVTASGGLTAAYDNALRMGFANATSNTVIFVTNVTSASGGSDFLIKPKGRYVCVRLNNDAANAQGPTASVSLIAYPT